ncbi:MAG TPA: hypothetical protein VGI47_02830 [Candidatus Binataceae bacterium]
MSAVSESDLNASIRLWGRERRLPEVHLGRWLAMPALDQRAMLELARGLRLRAGQMIVILDLMADLVATKEQPARVLLENAGPRRAVEAKGSSPARGAALIAALRALRYPGLTETAERIAAEIRALKLGAQLTVTAPKNLASDEITILIKVNRREQIDAAITALMQKKSALVRILAILHGED